MECPILYAELEKFVPTMPVVPEMPNATNKEIAAAFNAQTAKRFHPLTPKAFLDSLSSAELFAMKQSDNADAAAIMLYVAAGLDVDVEPGTACRGRLNAIKDDATLGPVVTAIKKASDETYPLWQKLGCERAAHHGDVAWIRKQIRKQELAEETING